MTKNKIAIAYRSLLGRVALVSGFGSLIITDPGEAADAEWQRLKESGKVSLYENAEWLDLDDEANNE